MDDLYGRLMAERFPGVARSVIPLANVRPPQGASGLFSPAQWRIVIGYSRDMRPSDMARELVLAPNTIKTHSRAIRDALGVKTAQGIVAECFRRGWLQ